MLLHQGWFEGYSDRSYDRFYRYYPFVGHCVLIVRMTPSGDVPLSPDDRM